MWCAHCLQPVNGFIEHELCKENIWLAMSEEYTRAREAFKKQYDFTHHGETVEIRAPLTRSVSR